MKGSPCWGIALGSNIGGIEKLLLVSGLASTSELLWEPRASFGDFGGNLGKIGVDKVLEFTW